jgi:hypothetical protein
LARQRDIISIEIVALVSDSERAALESAVATAVDAWEAASPDAYVTTLVARVEDQSREKHRLWTRSFADDAVARRRADR